MNLFSTLLLLLIAAATCSASANTANTAVTDSHGKVVSIKVGDRSVAASVDLRLGLRGDKVIGLADAVGVEPADKDGASVFKGFFETAPGKRCDYEETLREADGQVTIDFQVTGQADVESVFVALELPVDDFAGGLAETFKAGSPTDEGWGPLSTYKPVATHFQTAERQWILLRAGSADRMVLTDAAQKTRLIVTLGRPVQVAVRDTRETKGSVYSCVMLLANKLDSDKPVSLRVTIKPEALPGRTPVNLSVDASKVRYSIDGIGGNYCFNSATPVTDYTFEHINSAWARTEMSLEQWATEDGHVTANKIDWDHLKAQDKPGTNLHNELVMAQRLQKKGVPYVISCWDIPKWFYEDPERPGRVAPKRWPDLAAFAGAYLTYAKQQYGVEPDLFSFNEPDRGVRVKMSAQEHRDQIKLFGAYFKSLGLRTRMLLGDGVEFGNSGYIKAAADDPEAMKYVGAVAFHSWGRPSRPVYERWAAAAESLKLPLLVTEVGADVNAHRDKSWTSFCYALLDLRQYQDLLLYARPQGTMQWEFTRDYGLVDTSKTPAGGVVFNPSQRFFFIQQLCNFIPGKSDALGVSSSAADVLFTAFSGEVSGRKVYTLHIANFGGGAPRTARISGIPAGVQTLRAIQTGVKDQCRELQKVKVTAGKAEVQLQPESLLTLTTAP